MRTVKTLKTSALHEALSFDDETPKVNIEDNGSQDASEEMNVSVEACKSGVVAYDHASSSAIA